MVKLNYNGTLFKYFCSLLTSPKYVSFPKWQTLLESWFDLMVSIICPLTTVKCKWELLFNKALQCDKCISKNISINLNHNPHFPDVNYFLESPVHAIECTSCHCSRLLRSLQLLLTSQIIGGIKELVIYPESLTITLGKEK